MLAHTYLLVADADDAVAGHLSTDPLLPVALRMSQLMPEIWVARAEAALWSEVAQRLVWTLRVVVAHPLIEPLLGCLQVAEHLPGVELGAEAAVEALDLAGGGRRPPWRWASIARSTCRQTAPSGTGRRPRPRSSKRSAPTRRPPAPSTSSSSATSPPTPAAFRSDCGWRGRWGGRA